VVDPSCGGELLCRRLQLGQAGAGMQGRTTGMSLSGQA
jgi:hypothetical protein